MSLKNEAQVTAAPSVSRAQAFQGCSALVPQGISTEKGQSQSPQDSLLAFPTP